MTERVPLRITRISIEEHGEPSTVTIRAKVDSLAQLRQMAEECRRAKARSIAAELSVPLAQPAVIGTREVVQAEHIEQVIVDGLANMSHSGQIARALIRRFGGRCFAEDSEGC